MRKIFLIITICFASCFQISRQSNQQRAESLVKRLLDSTLNNPHSYESVSFSKLYKLKDTVAVFEGRTDTIKYNGWYEISHTFRATNEFGAIATRSEWFQIDSAMTRAICCFREPFSYYK